LTTTSPGKNLKPQESFDRFRSKVGVSLSSYGPQTNDSSLPKTNELRSRTRNNIERSSSIKESSLIGKNYKKKNKGSNKKLDSTECNTNEDGVTIISSR
jgi:hypothetical protein